MTDTRNALLGAKKLFTEKVFKAEIEEGKFIEVLIKQPSVKDRAETSKAALTKDAEDGEFSYDGLKFLIKGIIQCAIDPKTKEPLFTDADYDSLVAFPSGSWVDKLGAEVEKILNVSLEDKKKD